MSERKLVSTDPKAQKAQRWAEQQTDAMLASEILEALLAANADVYGPEGNREAIAALDEIAFRLTDRTDKV